MTLPGLSTRTEQALNSVSERAGAYSDESGSWPTRGELEPGYASINPRTYSRTDFWGAEDFELTLSFGSSESNDTIPSPPPELDSAPCQDER